MAKKKAQSREEILESEVIALRAEVAQLKANQKNGSSFIKFIKGFGVGVSVLFCALALNLWIVSGWLKLNIINSDTWTEKATQIIQTESIRNDIATQLTTEIMTATDVENRVKAFVPEEAAPLVGPLTSSLQSFITQQVEGVMASEKFQQNWVEINANVHTGIIASLENGGKKPDGDYVVYIDNNQMLLNLKPLVKQVQSQLSDTRLSFVSNINTDRINKTIPLGEVQNLSSLLVVFEIINRASEALLVLGIALGAVAIWLGENRRRVIAWLAGLTGAISLLMLRAIDFALNPAANGVSSNSNISSASSQALLNIYTTDLITYLRALLVVCLLILVGTFLAGQSKAAKSLRAQIARLTAKKSENPVIKHLSSNTTAYIAAAGGLYALLIVLNPIANITVDIILLIIVILWSTWLLSIRTEATTRSRK